MVQVVDLKEEEQKKTERKAEKRERKKEKKRLSVVYAGFDRCSTLFQIICGAPSDFSSPCREKKERKRRKKEHRPEKRGRRHDSMDSADN